MFQHFDTVIAFVVLMLVASLFITATTQLVVSLLGLRGANLRRSLVDLFETACPDQEAGRWAKEIARRVLRHPAISDSVFSRFCLRADRLPFIPPETAGKLQGASALIPLLPWIVGGVGGFFVTPIVLVIAKRLFAAETCKYSDLLAGYVSAINFCQHPWRTGALVGAILGGLLSRWRLATSVRVEELLAVLEKLSDPLPGTLPDPAQHAMLTIVWTENEPGARAKPGPAQAGRPVYSEAYFDEGIVRHASTAAPLQNERFDPAAADFDEGIVRHAEPVEMDGGVAVAVEKVTAQAQEPEPESTPATGGLTEASVPAPPEPRLEGLRAWFDHVMDRASQRFTLKARLVTVVLSCIFVFAAHFDSVRLFQSMFQGAELRARLAASAEAIDNQAEKLSHSKEGAHTVVPDVYRKVMASVLRTVAAVPEPPKPKVRRVSHTVAPPPRNSQQSDGDSLSMATTEDKFTAEAKAKARHALEAVPGFASREDAESWLRTTLDGNPARERLAAAYQQEVNAELVSDSDKLIDESASLKSDLARSEFKLFPDGRVWAQSSNEVPGLLVTVAFLSLGAAFWYNTLKSLASLRPQLAIRQDRERKHEKPA
ncbi:MAG: hypothetical protein DMG54_22475 [Acidobacteria bacterium]|nr:MAG: hypothetical protein DMG54_22475 [Acidobacteriota bacterium]